MWYESLRSIYYIALKDMKTYYLKPPAGYFNLAEMLAGLIVKGVPVKVCGTCLVRCGIHKNKSLIKGTLEAKMPELAEWILECDKVISF